MLKLLQRIWSRSNSNGFYNFQLRKINFVEPELKGLTDEEIKSRGLALKEFVRDNIRENLDFNLDSVLVEAFALVREASCRTLGMRHFDVQMICGMALHSGMVAEMKTGEGKTLAATLPIYLNSLAGRGVHVVTVNDYLAKRDMEWMAPIYQFLGASVGCIVSGCSDFEKRHAYQCCLLYTSPSPRDA